MFHSPLPRAQTGACPTSDSGSVSRIVSVRRAGGGSIKGAGADAATIAFRGMWNVGNSVREGGSQMREADLMET